MYIVYLGEYFQTITKHPRRSHATNLNNNSYKERKADHVVVYTSTYTYIRATNQLTNQHNNSCPCRHSLREPCESQEEYNVVTTPATASSLFSEHLYHRNDARIPPRVCYAFVVDVAAACFGGFFIADGWYFLFFNTRRLNSFGCDVKEHSHNLTLSLTLCYSIWGGSSQ